MLLCFFRNSIIRTRDHIILLDFYTILALARTHLSIPKEQTRLNMNRVFDMTQLPLHTITSWPFSHGILRQVVLILLCTNVLMHA